jgi:hypothetical protein
LAADCLGGCLVPPGGTPLIEPGTTGVILGFEVDNLTLMAAVIHLSVRAKDGVGLLDYRIRSVACEIEDDPTAYVGDPRAGDGHYRGSWDGCEIRMSNAESPFQCDAAYDRRRLRITYSGVGDIIFTQHESYDWQRATDNGGNYGVTYHLEMSFHNNGEATRQVEMRILAQDVGGPYRGAAFSDEDDEPRGIPEIDWVTMPNGTQRIFDFGVQHGESVTRVLEIMHAGGATMPVAFWLRRR